MSIRVRVARLNARVNRKVVSIKAGSRVKKIASSFLQSSAGGPPVGLRAARIRLKVNEYAVKDIQDELRKHAYSSSTYKRLVGKMRRIQEEGFPYTVHSPRLHFELCLAATRYALFSVGISRVSRVHPFDRNALFYSLSRVLTGRDAIEHVLSKNNDRFHFLSRATDTIAKDVGLRKARKIVQNFDKAITLLENQIRTQGLMKDPLPRSAQAP